MANFKDFQKDISRQARELSEFMGGELLDIIQVEGLNHFEESFDNEGFTDSSLKKWQKRKTKDKLGRDITRYRTSRRGKIGSLNAYGRKNKGRKVLTGHHSGGNKLRNSLRANIVSGGVQFASDKIYAQRHNEGLSGMPQRQFMGPSRVLNRKIIKKVERSLDKIYQP